MVFLENYRLEYFLCQQIRYYTVTLILILVFFPSGFWQSYVVQARAVQWQTCTCQRWWMLTALTNYVRVKYPEWGTSNTSLGVSYEGNLNYCNSDVYNRWHFIFDLVNARNPRQLKDLTNNQDRSTTYNSILKPGPFDDLTKIAIFLGWFSFLQANFL